jgi:23S rRNA G2069 N7-methylase RlmK/C1962 C5-methylase RlmI
VRKVNGYRVYAKEADALGLTNLGKIGDWVHVQSSSAGSPPGSWTEINARMKQRWG